MTREEFQTERTRIISEMLDNPDEYGIYPTTKCFEQLDALFDSLSLPPAEGAEAFVKSKGLNLDYVKGIQLFLNPKYTVIDLMTEFAAQQQPTAEGAEEILEGQLEILQEAGFKIPLKHGTIYNRIIDAMHEFATLHAQRLAEKMVEEKMREELMKFDAWLTGHGVNEKNVLVIREVDEYLKSREK